MAAMPRFVPNCRLLLFSLTLLLCGCMHRIAPYDATLDSTMTQVQQDTELFFAHLQFADTAGEATYASNKKFYEQTEATLHTLLTRARSVPKSQAAADQVANILAGIEKLQKTHQRDEVLNPTLLGLERSALESQFQSFFILELALKSRAGTQSSSVLAPALHP